MKPCRGFDSGSKQTGNEVTLKFVGFVKFHLIKVSTNFVVVENPDQGALNYGPVAQPGDCLAIWAIEHLLQKASLQIVGMQSETFNQVVASPNQLWYAYV